MYSVSVLYGVLPSIMSAKGMNCNLVQQHALMGAVFDFGGHNYVVEYKHCVVECQ